jgi:hypothetical protein
MPHQPISDFQWIQKFRTNGGFYAIPTKDFLEGDYRCIRYILARCKETQKECSISRRFVSVKVFQGRERKKPFRKSIHEEREHWRVTIRIQNYEREKSWKVTIEAFQREEGKEEEEERRVVGCEHWIMEKESMREEPITMVSIFQHWQCKKAKEIIQNAFDISNIHKEEEENTLDEGDELASLVQLFDRIKQDLVFYIQLVYK